MTPRRRSLWCALFLGAVLAAAIAVVAFGAPTTPVNALNKVEATRAQAFGGAASALGNDPTLVWVNPAAAAAATGPTLTLGGQRGYFEDLTGQGLVVVPLAPGVLTAGLLYYDAGVGTGVFATDGTAWGAPLQQDVLGAAGYALSPLRGVSAGGMLKALHSRLDEQAAGWSASVDAGAQARVNDSLKLGAVVQNLGTRMTYATEPVSSPVLLRGGAAMGWRLRDPEAEPGAPANAVILAADAEYRIVDRVVVWHLGAEYQWRDMISLRAGTRLASLSEPSVVAAGAGLKLGGARLDYSVRFNTDFGMPQTLSVTVAIPTRKAPPAPATEPGAPYGPGEEVSGARERGGPPFREAPIPVPSGYPAGAAEDGATFAPLEPPDPGTSAPTAARALGAGSVLAATAVMDSRPANDLIEDLNRQLDEIRKQTGK